MNIAQQDRHQAGSTDPDLVAGHQDQVTPRLIRLPRVREITALSSSEIWRRVRRGPAVFPQPYKLGPATTVFVEAEITDWVRAQIADRDAHIAADGGT